MQRKIELNELGEVVHIYTIYQNPEDTAFVNPIGLDIDEAESKLFDYFFDNYDLMRRIYRFKNGIFEKRKESEIVLEIADWVDSHPIVLPDSYYKNEKGMYKVNRKKIKDMTPEELNEVVQPIPVLSDFPEVPLKFIKYNWYEKQ